MLALAFPLNRLPLPIVRRLLPVRRFLAGVLVGCILCLSCAECLVTAAPLAGLTVSGSGDLQRGGAPYRGVGVNYYDLFVRTLGAVPATNYEAGLAELAERKIPFARFSAGGYWPADWGLYQTNRAEHFARLDAVVRSAERYDIGLIPSFFWMLSTVPDLVGEPVSRWGDTNSRTHAFMLTYTREVVLRYRGSPAIWGWEFGNEYNLAADLPNATDHRPPVVPSMGTPATRSAADELTHDMVRTALRAFAEEVRRHDPYRIIVSGHAFPRVSAWHQIEEKSWRRDTFEQFSQVLSADNPSPINTFSVRAYDLTNDLGRVAQAMDVSRKMRKPLFVGEFGVPGGVTAESREAFKAVLQCIETNQVPLSALWVFDFAAQAKDYSVTTKNERAWQLEEVRLVNERLWTRMGAQRSP